MLKVTESCRGAWHRAGTGSLKRLFQPPDAENRTSGIEV
jgi:hypothetical protein